MTERAPYTPAGPGHLDCRTCRFADPALYAGPAHDEGHFSIPFALCRRRSPIAGKADHQFPTFPKLLMGGWCGEWESATSEQLKARMDIGLLVGQ